MMRDQSEEDLAQTQLYYWKVSLAHYRDSWSALQGSCRTNSFKTHGPPPPPIHTRTSKEYSWTAPALLSLLLFALWSYASGGPKHTTKQMLAPSHPASMPTSTSCVNPRRDQTTVFCDHSRAFVFTFEYFFTAMLVWPSQRSARPRLPLQLAIITSKSWCSSWKRVLTWRPRTSLSCFYVRACMKTVTSEKQDKDNNEYSFSSESFSMSNFIVTSNACYYIKCSFVCLFCSSAIILLCVFCLAYFISPHFLARFIDTGWRQA